VDALVKDGELTLLYRIIEGPADQSFGLHVAQVTNFPQTIIEDAQKKAQELTKESEENQFTRQEKSSSSSSPLNPSVVQLAQNFLNDLQGPSGLIDLQSVPSSVLIRLRSQLEKNILFPQLQQIIQEIP